MMKLQIASHLGDYEVLFSSGFEFLQKLSAIEPKVVIIDRKVFELYRDLIQSSFSQEDILYFDALEENKGLDAVCLLYEELIKRQAKKNLTLISLGGGITQDVTGFLASTIYRGIPWIFIPTTLLAQADSCIGSKTSLNFKRYKNLIGTFYPPRQVYIDTSFLHTLAKADLYSGLGEVVKLQLMQRAYPKDYAAIVRASTLDWQDGELLLNLIYAALQVKIDYMQDDEFDRGQRNLLNYGHCFGHALETTSDYYVAHGTAVVIGMMFANAISVKRGLLGSDTEHSIRSEILMPCVPIPMQKDHFDAAGLLMCMRNDKKRIGANLTMIIPDQDFHLHKVNDVREEEFAEALADIKHALFSDRAL